jgi:hypothetical protein
VGKSEGMKTFEITKVDGRIIFKRYSATCATYSIN